MGARLTDRAQIGETAQGGLRARLVRHRWLALGAIMALAAALRFGDIGREPLWLDEAYSVWFSEQSWRFLWVETPKFETHPPFYYTLLKLWRGVAGSSEAALRIPSALASLGVVGLLYAAGCAMGGARRGWALGLAAAFLAAVWRSQIEFGQDARPYAFAALGVALLMAGALRILCCSQAADIGVLRLYRAAPQAATGFGAVALGMALTLWSHNLGAIPVLLAGLFLAGWWASLGFKRTLLGNLAVTAAAAFALYAPNLPTLLVQSRMVSGGFWIEAPATLWQLAEMSVQIYGQPMGDLGAIRAAGITCVLLALGLAGLWRAMQGVHGASAALLFTLVMLAGPWIVLVAVTYLVQPVLLPRTLIFVAPPALLALAGLPWAAPQRLRAAAAVSVLVVAALGAFRPTGIFTGDRAYGALVRAIADSTDNAAPVLIAPNSVALALDYYAARQGLVLDLRPLPAPYPARDPGFAYPAGGRGVAGLDVAAADAAVAALGVAPVVWMVSRRFDLYDPTRLLENRLIASGRCRSDVSGSGDIAVTLSRFGYDTACDVR